MAHEAAGAQRKWVTPQDNPAIVARHALALVQREGLGGIVSGAGRFLTTLLSFIYQDSELRLYHLQVATAATGPVAAPLDDMSLHIIESREDALRLAAGGYENILDAAPRAEQKLELGAVAACAFVGHEMASIDWMALSDRARQVVDRLPYPIDFAAGEACTGGAFTLRRLRRLGIAAYRFSAEVRYLRARGFRVCFSAIAADNAPSRRTVERYGATFDAVFRHRRLLGRNTYTPVRRKTEATSPAPGCDVRNAGQDA